MCFWLKSRSHLHVWKHLILTFLTFLTILSTISRFPHSLHFLQQLFLFPNLFIRSRFFFSFSLGGGGGGKAGPSQVLRFSSFSSKCQVCSETSIPLRSFPGKERRGKKGFARENSHDQYWSRVSRDAGDAGDAGANPKELLVYFSSSWHPFSVNIRSCVPLLGFSSLTNLSFLSTECPEKKVSPAKVSSALLPLFVSSWWPIWIIKHSKTAH